MNQTHFVSVCLSSMKHFSQSARLRLGNFNGNVPTSEHFTEIHDAGSKEGVIGLRISINGVLQSFMDFSATSASRVSTELALRISQ